MSTKNSDLSFKRVYVWELPVRVFHWANALAITVLAITGFIIADPPAIMSGAEASSQFWFGTVRLIHFISAYVFLFVMLLRIYWAFVGNRYSSWRSFLPLTQKAIQNIKHVLKVDVLLGMDKEHRLGNIAIGHNAVAGASYMVLFFFALIMIATGFGLYEPMSNGFIPDLFAWVIPLFGSDFTVRLIHHVTTWLMILFVIIHVYLVFYHDWLEGRGEVSSMFSGYKFVLTDRIKSSDTLEYDDTAQEQEEPCPPCPEEEALDEEKGVASADMMRSKGD
jgi:Ni/Fe-hydrogenase 1 B-type cytochrome subunit